MRLTVMRLSFRVRGHSPRQQASLMLAQWSRRYISMTSQTQSATHATLQRVPPYTGAHTFLALKLQSLTRSAMAPPKCLSRSCKSASSRECSPSSTFTDSEKTPMASRSPSHLSGPLLLTVTDGSFFGKKSACSGTASVAAHGRGQCPIVCMHALHIACSPAPLCMKDQQHWIVWPLSLMYCVLPYSSGAIWLVTLVGFRGCHRPCRCLSTSCSCTPTNHRAGGSCWHIYHGNVICPSVHIVLLN